MASYSLKLFFKNCGQIAADGDVVTIASLWEVATALFDEWYHRRFSRLIV